MKKILDWILPTPCVICLKLGAPFCVGCKTSFVTSSLRFEILGVPGFAISTYSAEAAVIVNSVKEKGVTSLIPYLAELIVPHWPEEFLHPVLVPIPSSPSNAKKRGFAHTSLMARALARRVAGASTRELLKSSRVRIDQVGLSPVDRAKNLEGAFRADLRGFLDGARPVVLVDDVLTSGATMAEALDCLRANGVEVAGFCVFARAGAHQPSVYKGRRPHAAQSKME